MAAGTTALFIAVFLACIVEAVEAVTIVLAAGTARDWRSAGTGTGAALAVLAAITSILGPAVSRIPLGGLRVVVGALLLVFGLQWLRKAILRASGHKELHDEQKIYARQVAAAGAPPGRGGRPGAGLVRFHAVVQGRPARRPRGRLHRPDFRYQPARRRAGSHRRRMRRGACRRHGSGSAGSAVQGAGEHHEVHCRDHAHRIRHLLGGRGRGSALAGLRRLAACAHPGHRGVRAAAGGRHAQGPWRPGHGGARRRAGVAGRSGGSRLTWLAGCGGWVPSASTLSWAMTGWWQSACSPGWRLPTR